LLLHHLRQCQKEGFFIFFFQDTSTCLDCIWQQHR
jgi:hypothetical protein